MYSPAASSSETLLRTVRAPKRFVTPLRLSTVESYSMNRRTLLAAFVVYGVRPPIARAQRQAKVHRIGVLSARKVPSLDADPSFAAFFAGMRELGYVRGKDFVVEYRSADGDYERLPQLAAELVALQVDVILAAGGPTVAAAQKATTSIPIVIGTAGDPVGSGFVRSLARPGGNITGLTDVAADMGFKLLDTLLSAVPGLTHVGVLMNPGNPSHASYLASIDDGARRARVRVLRASARNAREIEAAFDLMVREKVRGAIALTDPAFNPELERIAALAARHRLPCISGHRQYVHAGGLISYGVDFAHNFHRAATYVDKILKGASPAELPVEQASRFELAVNLKAAKALGLSIPGAVLVRADEVVQ
jgi:putative tryptophan/tyrosine transport system substrate-binding protein